MSKIIIEVRGGNIVGVYGHSQKTRVTIIDWDNLDAGDISAAISTTSCLPTSKIPQETANIITSKNN